MNRGLLVGINAYPNGNELNGCVNDVTDMADFLVSHRDFKEEDIRLVTDDRATTQAIKDRLQWLISGAAAGDRLIFALQRPRSPISDPRCKRQSHTSRRMHLSGRLRLDGRACHPGRGVPPDVRRSSHRCGVYLGVGLVFLRGSGEGIPSTHAEDQIHAHAGGYCLATEDR